MSGGSPRVVVPDRRHVAAWVAGDAAVHGEVSRYADSSDEDGEWDSIGGGGVAACQPPPLLFQGAAALALGT